MKKQDASNYIRFYTPHHFIFYPVACIMAVISCYFSFKYREQHFEWMATAIAFVLILWLSFMMRQHYALTLQDRIVRLEMSVRYHQLTGSRLEDVGPGLTFGQISSLRFASDAELQQLVNHTITEKLSPADIKKAITNWKEDHLRV